MKVVDISCWTDYVACINELQRKHHELRKESNLTIYPLLFRGQPDSEMLLQTTLERELNGECTLLKYFLLVSRFVCKVESVTGVSWPLLNGEEYSKELLKPQFPLEHFPCCEYYAYLRHHGFPSPLLDWSRSPYVALLFAFMRRPSDDKGQVSVFTYLESLGGVRILGCNDPVIHSIGHYLRTHMRHHLQQSDCTVCTSGEAVDVCFASHEEVFKRANPDQDLLWKLNIPKSQRLNFLEHLYQMNVTPYSLFQTEDKLMEDLWLSEGVLRQKFM